MTRPDTIAAISTARGRAALAVVRLSGPRAVPIAASLMRGTDLEQAVSHSAHVGVLEDPSGRRIDQVVATLFRAPTSATGEDVVEISCHGGDVAPQLVLRAMMEAGARPARPGEFTERAFLNGKLDLAQAEAVADLIHARSSRAQAAAVKHLEGRYSDALAEVRRELLQLCALVELELDFVEEDVEFADRSELQQLLDRAMALVVRLLGTYRFGALLREGVRVVIGGRPNAGKSTLLNALVGDERAIVSNIPGTTRDAIEAEIEIGGLSFRFVDTAGLRESTDAIETEGVRRAEDAARKADVFVYVVDAVEGMTDAEQEWLNAFRADADNPPTTLVLNKVDLLDPGASHARHDAIYISAEDARRKPELLTPLWERLVALVELGAEAEDGLIVVNERHRQHLTAAREALSRAAMGLEQGGGGDTVALDLRTALREIGSVTGEVTNEDVLGAIFSQFCIGK